MKILKILLPVFLGLGFSISDGFSGDVTTTSSYDNIAIIVEARYDDKYALDKKYIPLYSDDETSRFLIGNQKVIHFFDEHNVIRITVTLKNPETGRFHVINEQKINGLHEAIISNQIYTKFLLVGNRGGYIKYNINIKCSKDEMVGFVVDLLDIEILELVVAGASTDDQDDQQDMTRDIL